MDYNTVLQQGIAKQSILQEEIKTITTKIKTQEAKLKNIQLAQVFIQTVAKETQENLQVHIQDLVQSALDTCFPGEFDFFVQFEIKRGKTEANLLLFVYPHSTIVIHNPYVNSLSNQSTLSI